MQSGEGGGSRKSSSSSILLNKDALGIEINPPGEQLKAVAKSVAPMHLEFQHAKGASLSQASHGACGRMQGCRTHFNPKGCRRDGVPIQEHSHLHNNTYVLRFTSCSAGLMGKSLPSLVAALKLHTKPVSRISVRNTLPNRVV